MKKIAGAAVLGALLIATGAQAEAATFTDYATVLTVQPVREHTTTRQCATEPGVGATQGQTIVGTAIGAGVGGLIGHQIGHGRGNTVATLAGAVGGALLGGHVADNAYGGSYQQCQDVDSYNIVRYDVTYEYHGIRETASMNRDPGPQMPVTVTVQPGM